MDASTLEKRFLKINKKLGMLTGVWPYQNDTSKTIRRAVVMFIVIPVYITQYARVIVFPRVDILLNDYPYLIVGFGVLVKFGNYSLINESQLKSLLGKIYEDWRNTMTDDEYKIMLKYANRGALAVTLYTLHIVAIIILFLFLPYVPPILDFIIPLNESREPLYIYPAYYFIDHAKYYRWIIAHMTVAAMLLCLVFCACDANYVYAVQHACGLLAVASYRFKHACHEVTGWDQKSTMSDRQMYKNVCHSIRGHRRALEYVAEITAVHDSCMFITVGLLMISISASLLQISENDKSAQWFTNCMFFTAQLFHMLFLVIQGQFVLNSYDDIYSTIYESTWYNASCNTQILYVLALRSSLYPPVLTAGGFITLNLKTFAEIIKTSVSYYTVMRST